MAKARSQPFRYLLRVRYHECDMQRVVFNGNYASYVDMACTEFMKALLPGRHSNGADPFELQLVRQLIEWTGPARFDDVIEISTWCSRIGTTSFDLSFEMRKPGEERPFVTAQTVNVAVDHTTWKKMPIPPHVRALLERGVPGGVVDHAGHLARPESSVPERPGALTPSL